MSDSRSLRSGWAVTGAIEPCGGCGEDTAVGSVRFSDRHDLVGSDGVKAYLCAECYQRARALKGGEPLTDEDMEAIAKNGFVMGVHWLVGSG